MEIHQKRGRRAFSEYQKHIQVIFLYFIIIGWWLAAQRVTMTLYAMMTTRYRWLDDFNMGMAAALNPADFLVKRHQMQCIK